MKRVLRSSITAASSSDAMNPYYKNFQRLGFSNASDSSKFVYHRGNWIAEINSDGTITAFYRWINDTAYLGCPAHGSIRRSITYKSWNEFESALERTKKGAYIIRHSEVR